MALVVETGAGLASAESYCTVSFFLQYHADRGNSSAALLAIAEIEAALRKATDYMLQAYRNRWSGYRRYAAQSLDWPRSGVVIDNFVYVDANSVPVDVQCACCEFALKASSGDLFVDTEQKIVKSTVGPITVEYDKNSPQDKRYSSMDALLSPYLVGMGNRAMARLVRS